MGHPNEPVDSGLYAPAVERALEILERLAGHPAGLTLSDLAAQLELPKNAVFRITNTLRERGYLARDARTMRFTLTEKLLRVSQPRVEKKSLIELSMEPLRELRDATRETVQIGRRLGTEGVILEAVETLHPLRISVDPGLRFPLYNNAPGKLLLAQLPLRERKAMLDDLDLTPCTPRTITDRRELARECDRILEQGYSTDSAEADEGIHCVAAAIRDPHGACVATVWVSAPSKRMPRSSFAGIGRQVRATGDKISERLRNP
jgi:DNA-binding IclR family transcriptional regulator